MKNTKNILFALVVVAVIGLQIGYLLTTYQDDKAKIADLNRNLEDNRRYLSQLQERVAMLPETKKELELMTAQKNAMLNTIPLFKSATNQIVEMNRYANLKNLVGVQVSYQIEPSEEVDKSIYEEQYNISMIGRYNDIRDFVDGLNSSYQIVNISAMNINNGIQSSKDKETANTASVSKVDYAFNQLFKNDYSDVVEAEMSFSIYSRVNGENMDEIYDPNFNMQVNKKDMFKFKQEIVIGKDDEVGPSLGTTDENETTPSNKNYDKFTLNIGDVFTSGDTYKLGGPEGYIGLISKANTEIKITINKAGYDMSIQDINGQEKTTHVDIDITNPKLNIISTMRQLEDVMPSIHVYVYNYTDEMMEVEVDGSMLGNIHIFNENNKEVQKGQVSGNIMVS